MKERLRRGSGRGRFLAFVLTIGFLTTAVAALPLQALAEDQSQARTLKIGYIACLTGFYSGIDRNDDRDVKIVAQMINEKGGITVKGQKYKVELAAEDGKSSFDGVSSAATRLAYEHKVKFVLGPSAFFSKASSPILERNKILHISGYTTMSPGEVDPSTPYGFVTNSPMNMAGGALEFLKKEYPNLKKVALITPDDSAVQYLVPKVKKLLEFNGYTLVGQPVAFSNEMVDASPVAAKLNAIKDAELYFHLHGMVQSVGNIIKGLRELGNEKLYVVCVNAVADELLKSTGKSAGTAIINLGIVTSAKNPPLIEEIMKRSGPGNDHYLDIPGALWVLAQIIETADSVDPAAVKAQWEKMDTVGTLFGPGTITGDDSFGIKHHCVTRPYSYSKIMNGTVAFGAWQPKGSRIP